MLFSHSKHADVTNFNNLNSRRVKQNLPATALTSESEPEALLHIQRGRHDNKGLLMTH